MTMKEETRARAETALRAMLELSGGWKAPAPVEAELDLAGMGPSGCGCA